MECGSRPLLLQFPQSISCSRGKPIVRLERDSHQLDFGPMERSVVDVMRPAGRVGCAHEILTTVPCHGEANREIRHSRLRPRAARQSGDANSGRFSTRRRARW